MRYFQWLEKGRKIIFSSDTTLCSVAWGVWLLAAISRECLLVLSQKFTAQCVQCLLYITSIHLILFCIILPSYLLYNTWHNVILHNVSAVPLPYLWSRQFPPCSTQSQTIFYEARKPEDPCGSEAIWNEQVADVVWHPTHLLVRENFHFKTALSTCGYCSVSTSLLILSPNSLQS